MNRKNLTFRWLAVAFVALAATLAAWLLLRRPVQVFYWHEFRAGNAVVSRIEAFRKANGRLPESLKDIGITDPDFEIFYQKADGEHYYVWFGTELGESETYDSDTKKWDWGNRAID